MSKAEQNASKLIIPKQVDDVEELCRFYCIKGYHQAEKDLALTWKDIELIVNIDKDTDNEESIIGVRNNEEHYKEVLKQFNKMKKE